MSLSILKIGVIIKNDGSIYKALALIGGVFTTQAGAVFYFPEQVAFQIVASLKPTPFEFFLFQISNAPPLEGMKSLMIENYKLLR